MFTRVVRFTDVTQDRIDAVRSRIESNDGPPPGVEAVGMKLFFDADQGTALFMGFFETREKMDAAHEILEGMDVAETPGTRTSVDRAELVIERDD